MRTPALQERRNRQILADVVRAYIETGEPVSSRAVCARFEETIPGSGVGATPEACSRPSRREVAWLISGGGATIEVGAGVGANREGVPADASGITRTVPGSQPPARTLPDRVMADLGLDFAIAHPDIVIPSRIVGANMLEAEPIIVLQLQS